MESIKTTDAPLSVSNLLNNQKYTKENILQYHQFITERYVVNNPDSRGILLCYSMGFGKTISSIALSEFYRSRNDWKVVVLLAKSLVDNYKSNIHKYMNYSIQCTYFI